MTDSNHILNSLVFDFGPRQDSITEERIREMVNWTPRRMKLSVDWQKVLYTPTGENARLVLPFRETFENAFGTMCGDLNHHAYTGQNGRCTIFLNDSQSDQRAVEKATEWIAVVGNYVGIRDCLALSFALDYRMEGGDPQKSKTQIGVLCRRAKPYQGNANYDRAAARKLAEECVGFLQNMTAYDSADCVVAVPPSRPDKPFDLATYLASEIALAVGKPDLSGTVKTVKARAQLKATCVEEKLDELKGAVSADPESFKGKKVLIVDDLYQSGVSVNYLGMLLQRAGAKKLFSLACEKTVGNFDNLGSRTRTQ